MKRVFAVLLSILLLLSFTACSADSAGQPASAGVPAPAASSAQPYAGQEIEVMMYCNSSIQALDDAIYDMLDHFTEETGIEVSFNAPGDGYEELMKTRMASNDLPDVFCTHGWAVVRYGEYLLPLNDETWTANIAAPIKDVITDANGNILVLPSNYDCSGIDCNYTVLEEAGVDPASILTWDDFEDACEKVKAIGKTPICMGAKDSWMAAQFFQSVCPSTLTDEEQAAIEDGTFDWERMRPILERYVDWVDRGFFNVDCLTADFNTSSQLLASGEGAFLFCDASSISQGWTYYPDADMGMIPIPAADSANTPVSSVGEFLSWGVWKDSDHPDAAKALLAFFARPENVKILSEATTCLAGLDGVEYDLGALAADFEKVATYRPVPVWDRTLPSGMMNDLCTVGQSILTKEGDAVSKAITVLSNSYKEKMA